MNRPQKAKKPLVYTPRVKRLLVCAALVSLLWLLLVDYAFTVLVINGLWLDNLLLARFGIFLPAVLLPAWILLQHRIIMLYND